MAKKKRKIAPKLSKARMKAERVEEEDDGKDPAAKALGKKGGTARAKKLSGKRRTEIAKLAAAARWGS